jgi:hypothetical protein
MGKTSAGDSGIIILNWIFAISGSPEVPSISYLGSGIQTFLFIVAAGKYPGQTSQGRLWWPRRSRKLQLSQDQSVYTINDLSP